MAAIAIKRVYDGRASTDGMRILVDRLWPRGVSKDAAALDLWAKEVAPSPSLRTWFDHREDRFAEFKKRYLLELSSNPAVPDLVGQIGKRKATLLYGAKDPAINHAVVLTGYLGGYRARKNSDLDAQEPSSQPLHIVSFSGDRGVTLQNDSGSVPRVRPHHRARVPRHS
jgi:uncharacterized protein YeaO (DUF488 family)